MQVSAAQRLIEESFGVDDAIGRVVTVHGATACVGLRAPERKDHASGRATVGDFIGIRGGGAMIVAVVTDVSLEVLPVAREQGLHATATLDMVGEIKADPGGEVRFARGVTSYPAIGDWASMLTESELNLVYGSGNHDVIDIGALHGDLGLSANIHIDDMLHKHFAVVGTTGVGKSSGVAVILRAVMERRPDLRIFLIDAHNEYGSCFGDRAQSLTPANLRLPFWLFNFEEIVDVIFRGRPGPDDEVEILSDLIPAAKRMYEQTPGRYQALRGDAGYTVDTPVPYRLNDIFALIDERMGKLENRSSRSTYNKLSQRVSSVINDPRYAFMFEVSQCRRRHHGCRSQPTLPPSH